jgi:hypothetical protein
MPPSRLAAVLFGQVCRTKSRTSAARVESFTLFLMLLRIFGNRR